MNNMVEWPIINWWLIVAAHTQLNDSDITTVASFSLAHAAPAHLEHGVRVSVAIRRWRRARQFVRFERQQRVVVRVGVADGLGNCAGRRGGTDGRIESRIWGAAKWSDGVKSREDAEWSD